MSTDTVYLFERDASPEIATSTALYLRLKTAFLRKQKPDHPPRPSFVQLVGIVSEKIRQDPVNGHTIHTIMEILRTQGLVKEDDYYESLERGRLPDNIPRCITRGYRKFDSVHSRFVQELAEEIPTNGPVVAVIPICCDYGIDRASTLYLAEGVSATNEEDPNAILALALILTDLSMMDGIPYWVCYNHYSRNRDERGHVRIQLDALFGAYAPIIDPSVLPSWT